MKIRERHEHESNSYDEDGISLQAISSNELRSIFPNLRKDDFPGQSLNEIDWGVLDYLGWISPAGHKGFVVINLDDKLHGIALRRAINRSGKPKTQMCSWCHHVYRGRGTALFTSTVHGSHGRKSIGHQLCMNLDCSLRIRNLVSDPPTYLPETVDLHYKTARLRAAIRKFIQRLNAQKFPQMS